MATEASPPAFEPTNAVHLSSQKDSKILSVSVYAGRAEITRLFKFGVRTGQNQVTITDLPLAIDQQSFRVEGRGAATIHDVTISTIEPPPTLTTSETLQAHKSEHKKVVNSLARAHKALASLETFLSSLSSQHLDAAKLQSIVDTYDVTAEKLDNRISALEYERKKLDQDIEKEKELLTGPKGNVKLGLKSTIGVFADLEGEVEIALIYAVRNATWDAHYDIRVAMETKDKPVALIYKGAITQDTGEDWTDVPITLETAAPTFGVGIPRLNPWTLSVYRPVVYAAATRSKSIGGGAWRSDSRFSAAPGMVLAKESVGYAQALTESSHGDAIQYRNLEVSSKGNVTASFSVPGLMTIPSDNVAHNVTIVKLSLDATMEWVAVPKQIAKVHLKAKIKNASQYTLLAGQASVYVDGSFISRSDVVLVSPEESFDCPLGLDPSIRVTYLPLAKKITQSGFMSKSNNSVFTQRIAVHNTKSLAIENFKVIDQIPVSEDAIITVKLISPALDSPSSASGGSAGSLSSLTVENKAGVRIPAPVKVGQGVVAQWEGAEDVTAEDEVDALGKDGKLYWQCSLPAQGKVTLTLQWEVSAPLKTHVSGI